MSIRVDWFLRYFLDLFLFRSFLLRISKILAVRIGVSDLFLEIFFGRFVKSRMMIDHFLKGFSTLLRKLTSLMKRHMIVTIIAVISCVCHLLLWRMSHPVTYVYLVSLLSPGLVLVHLTFHINTVVF